MLLLLPPVLDAPELGLSLRKPELYLPESCQHQHSDLGILACFKRREEKVDANVVRWCSGIADEIES